MKDLKTKKIRPFALAGCIALPLAIGGLSALITSDAMSRYGSLTKPFLSPPGWLFPVVWTGLYAMMGIASYLVITSEGRIREKERSLIIYAGQLLLNFCWSILFFKYSMYFPAFLWLVVMWLMIILCTTEFFRINKTAGILMIPYILWTTFAAYLNLAVYLLNR